MVDLNSTILLITVNENCLNTSIKKHSVYKEISLNNGSNVEAAKAVGELVAKRALAAKIEAVVFDRGGYLYHGRVAALAEGAREAGLKF